MNIQYRKYRTPPRLKLKKGSQPGQPDHHVTPASKLNRPSIPTTTPMMTASINHATKRSHQNANLSPDTSGAAGAVGTADAAGDGVGGAACLFWANAFLLQ